MEIKFTEKEFRPLLDREKAVQDVRHAFSVQLEMLRDIVNYGTNLIPRCYNSSGKELEDIVVIGTLLRQVVAMLDGFELLTAGGAVYPAALQARALFEASVYIGWILQGDAARKAAYYYVHDLRSQRQSARLLQPGSPEATTFAAIVPDLEFLHDANAIEGAKHAIAEIDRVLSQPAFTAVNDAFDRHIARMKAKRDPDWYVPLGMRSVKALVNALGKPEEYMIFYAQWSKAMHSSTYREHVRIGKGIVTFQPLRHLGQFADLFRVTIALALRTYHTILAHYRPGELPAFGRKYKESWQSAYMEVPTIKYKSKQSNSV